MSPCQWRRVQLYQTTVHEQILCRYEYINNMYLSSLTRSIIYHKLFESTSSSFSFSDYYYFSTLAFYSFFYYTFISFYFVLCSSLCSIWACIRDCKFIWGPEPYLFYVFIYAWTWACPWLWSWAFWAYIIFFIFFYITFCWIVRIAMLA